ncbi:MAG: hypothetical protein VX589_21200 [Myxococcota bacterium]|nr:hypothetical protein [Myxococcota bacterium]
MTPLSGPSHSTALAMLYWTYLHSSRIFKRKSWWLLAGASVLWAVMAPHVAVTPTEGLEILITQLMPLCALFYGAGLIREEIEDQTLTYSFSSPTQRHWIYGARLTAAALPIAVLAGPPLLAFTMNTQGIDPGTVLLGALLSSLGYCAIFGILGQITQRPTWFGLIYLLLWESGASALPGLFSRFTFTHHLQTLMGIRATTGTFGPLTDATTPTESMVVLICMTGFGLLAGGILAARRSFYLRR